MMGFHFKMTHISDIRPGHVIERDGDLVTVGEDFIKRCPFMGVSLYGDTYALGTKLVKRAIITRHVGGKEVVS